MKRSQTTDDTPEDLRWQRLADAEAVGEASRAEAEFVREHRAEGDASRAEQELIRELRGRADAVEHGDRDADEALIVAAVGRFLAGPVASPKAEQERTRWRPVVLLGGLGTGLAAAASWLLLASPIEDVPTDIHTTSAQVAEAAPSPTTTPAADLWLLRGPASRAGRILEGDGPLALSDGPLELGAGACVGILGQLNACAPVSSAAPPPSTLAKLSLRGAALTLERGRLEVEIETAAPDVGIIFVQVAGVALLGDSPGVLTITHEEGSWEFRAERGSLELELDGEHRRLEAGEVLQGPLAAPPNSDLGDTAATLSESDPGDDTSAETGSAETPEETGGPAGRRPTSNPRDLLGKAQGLRGAGDYRAAARTYRRLIREHSDTSIARTAQASLGQLYLGPLHSPAQARRAFRDYLRSAPSGAMAEEALRGEIDALRQLGQDGAARRVGADFLRRFPGSGYAEGIRRDLEADEHATR